MAKETKLAKPRATDSAGAGLEPRTIPPEPAVPDAKTETAPKKAPKGYRANIFQSSTKLLPISVGEHVAELEVLLKRPVWLLIQDGTAGSFTIITRQVLEGFVRLREQLKADEPVALLIHSSGGDPSAAYQLAMTLNRRCGSFVAVVPRYAKSAATLLSLGAESIMLGACGELGPLDAQVFDPESEQWLPALDEVEALSRLNAFGLDALNSVIVKVALGLDLDRLSTKDVKSLLPLVIPYVTGLTRPLLEKVDVVRYTRKARALKVAEMYAERLLNVRHTRPQAKRLSTALAWDYPDHGFVIDIEELGRLGLEAGQLSADENRIVDAVFLELAKANVSTVVGRLEEVADAD